MLHPDFTGALALFGYQRTKQIVNFIDCYEIWERAIPFTGYIVSVHAQRVCLANWFEDRKGRVGLYHRDEVAYVNAAHALSWLSATVKGTHNFPASEFAAVEDLFLTM